MPTQRKKKEISSALLAKGFRVKVTHHNLYFLYYKEKKTSIFTKISHGGKIKIYNDSLLSMMSKQLRLTKAELLKLIDCTLVYEGYLKILIERGHLK